jgi:O-antigen/teichoic acid export membrane protein
VIISLYQWAKTNRIIFVNAGSLIGTTGVTSILGFAYWWLAARQFPTEAVGIASAAISAMTLLGTFCTSGLGTLVMGEVPRQSGKEASLISAVLIFVGGVGGCLGIMFAVIAPVLSPDFQTLRASIENIALFAVGVSFTAITLILDQALIGLLQGSLQLWRNALFALAKLIALFSAALWLQHVTGLTMYATWAVGNAFSLVALVVYVTFKWGWSRRVNTPQWSLLRKLGPAALQHHALNLTLQAPDLILPILVTILLSATANAWFYVSLRIASVALVIPVALTTVLYAASSAQPATLARKMRLTLSLAFATSVLTNCILLLGAKQLLSLFGHSYAEQAVWSLRILGFGTFPIIIRNHFVAIYRIQSRIAPALLPMIASGLLELGGATLGVHLGGLTGLSLGWLIPQCFVALFMVPTIYKSVRRKDAPTPANSFIQTSIQQAYIESKEELTTNL